MGDRLDQERHVEQAAHIEMLKGDSRTTAPSPIVSTHGTSPTTDKFKTVPSRIHLLLFAVIRALEFGNDGSVALVRRAGQDIGGNAGRRADRPERGAIRRQRGGDRGRASAAALPVCDAGRATKNCSRSRGGLED